MPADLVPMPSIHIPMPIPTLAHETRGARFCCGTYLYTNVSFHRPLIAATSFRSSCCRAQKAREAHADVEAEPRPNAAPRKRVSKIRVSRSTAAVGLKHVCFP